MIKLFRNIRKNLLAEGKTSRYFKYAIGEILLVVIGILIALQLNNWNQNQGVQKQLKIYRSSLLSELNKDLAELGRIDSINRLSTNTIKEYFTAFNSHHIESDSLNSKRRNVSATWNSFQTNIYSIDELIASGNISLFTHQEKLAIITLKKQIELYTYYEKQQAAVVGTNWDRFENLTDMAFSQGLTTKQNDKTTELNSDKNSDYFRFFNNSLASSLDYYTYQDYIYSKRIRPEILKLKTILLENSQ